MHSNVKLTTFHFLSVVIGSRAQIPTWSYESAKTDLLDAEISQLSSPDLVNYGIIGMDGSTYAMAAYSKYIETFSNTPSCEQQNFGYSEKFYHAKVICNTVDIAKGICESEESGCDVADMPLLLAGKGDVFSDLNIMSYFVCLKSNGFEPANCPTIESLASYTTKAEEIQDYIVNQVPGGYDSILMSNACGEFSGLPFQQQHFIIGDGAFELTKMANSPSRVKRSINNKIVAIRTLTKQYTQHEYTEKDFNEFYSLVVEGYFFKRYAHELLLNKEKKMTIKVYHETSTYPCAYNLGVLATDKCGYSAEDLLDFVRSYYEMYSRNLCKPLMLFHRKIATRTMRLRYRRRPKTRNPELCFQKLRFRGK